MTMMCGNCNRYGIHWVGPLGNLSGTKCPHCGGTDCQIPGEDEYQQVTCDIAACNCGQLHRLYTEEEKTELRKRDDALIEQLRYNSEQRTRDLGDRE